jgi:hypothetical protein
MAFLEEMPQVTPHGRQRERVKGEEILKERVPKDKCVSLFPLHLSKSRERRRIKDKIE